MTLFPCQMKHSYTTIVVSTKRLILFTTQSFPCHCTIHTGLMNLIHYWKNTATISLGEVCLWRLIVKVYAEKKLCVKFRTLSVQIIWNVWADNRYDIILHLLLNIMFIICSWLFFNISTQMCGQIIGCVFDIFILKIGIYYMWCVQLLLWM